jgi:hypothetical protein
MFVLTEMKNKPKSSSPFSYATIPYFWTGVSVGGRRPFASCADKSDYYSAECQDLKICVMVSSFSERLQQIFPDQNMVLVYETTHVYEFFNTGTCNVIAEYPMNIQYDAVKENGFTGTEDEYEVGNTLFTKSFETWQTRSDDRVWTKFTSWIWEAIVQAEESGVTKETASEMGTTELFDPRFRNMFRHAVKVLGKYVLCMGLSAGQFNARLPNSYVYYPLYQAIMEKCGRCFLFRGQHYRM